MTFPKRSVKSETVILIHRSREVKKNPSTQNGRIGGSMQSYFLIQCYSQEHLATWIFWRGDLDFLCLPFLNMTQTFCAYYFYDSDFLCLPFLNMTQTFCAYHFCDWLRLSVPTISEHDSNFLCLPFLTRLKLSVPTISDYDSNFLCLPFLNMTQTFCAYHFWLWLRLKLSVPTISVTHTFCAYHFWLWLKLSVPTISEHDSDFLCLPFLTTLGGGGRFTEAKRYYVSSMETVKLVKCTYIQKQRPNRIRHEDNK